MVSLLQVNSVYAGHSALQAACQNGHAEATKLLLKLKADTEAQVRFFLACSIKLLV